MHSNLRWDIQRLLKLLRPTSWLRSCKAPLPSDKVALHIDPLGHCLVHLREVSLQVFHTRDVLHLLRSISWWWFWPIAAYGFRTPDCTTPIATSEPTTKLPNPRSFNASCSVASRTAQPFSVTSTPTSPKRAYRAYPHPRMYSTCVSLLITYSHVHNDTMSVYKRRKVPGCWIGEVSYSFIFIHILQTSEEATAPNHSMKTPCDGKHQKVHLYRSIPIICAYMYSTYVHTYAYIIIYVSVKTFVFDSIQYPLKYETTPTYATYVIHLSHRSRNDWG